ncbi:MAG: tetratricopeptide repeat protein [Bacteroidetes bacterium]|nr:tetratricopeptide repeat protein [Bacteroidota bacterium]
MKTVHRVCLLTGFIFFIFITSSATFAQAPVTDSLLRLLKKYNAQASDNSLRDTVRISLLNRLSGEYNYRRDFSTAMKYARIAQNISEKLTAGNKNIFLKKFLANSFHSVAEIYLHKEDFANALIQYKNELKIREGSTDKIALAECLNRIGYIYDSQNDLSKSMEYFFRALKEVEQTEHKTILAQIYNSLGNAYFRQKKNEKALEYYQKELAVGEKQKDRKIIATAYTNLGNAYSELGKYDLAVSMQAKCLKMAEEENNKEDIASSLLNIGDLYAIQGFYTKALETNTKALKLFEELGNKYSIALAYFNQGNIYLSLARTNAPEKKKNIREAGIYLHNSLNIYEKSGQIEGMTYCYEAMSSLDSINGDFKGAFENYKKNIKYHDSLLNQENTTNAVRVEMNYEFHKKEAASNLEQEKKDAIALQENAKQKSIRNLFVVAFGFMLLLALFIFRSYHQKKKVNSVISAQKIEVEKQKWIVEKNQKQIIDSINYAKRIQSSMLPNQAILKKAFNESFIFYKPKDIVSGDFYWFYSIPGTSESIIVLADCTGHGVPGAFLSMVGTTLLTEIVCHKHISDPAEIIKALNTGLTSTLISKEQETHTDGMDLSICKVDPVNKKLSFAGANQTLYLVNNGKVEKIESQVNSIDGAFDLEGYNDFRSIEKELQANTSIFITTDGYADQTSELTHKKYMSSRFEDLLLQIHPLNSDQQLSVIENTFNTWKGNQKQIDDILVIGLKIS